ncbi:Mog1/PsbP, alpha/beta/alpha sandwich [Trema orientale]|uniref:Mog1/PsbP, alpha/beta/alpha sandwich n=1 Tax=Trema orientale TaxID=63057 RepID=A0A2P5EJ40_TREOI|nr:Mog1/PsbP, alpha/beta/alpha sandwich [Trema orientale]
MAILLSLSVSPHPPSPNSSIPNTPSLSTANPKTTTLSTRRPLILKFSSLLVVSFAPLQYPLAHSSAESSSPAKPSLSGIVNTKSWFQFFGDGFSIRVPPEFEDIMEPEDFNSGLSLYGDKVKPKTFAARFVSSNGSEVVSVIIRPTNQLKITFLEAQDITDLGSLKEAAKIFVPGGATLYSARTIKIKEDEGFRTYYFYEFGRYDQHVALFTAVNSGKAIIAGAAAPESKWEDDGVKLRSAAISMTVL